jgi:hypothetical protein
MFSGRRHHQRTGFAQYTSQLLLGLAFPGKYTNTGSSNSSSSLVLCREDVAGAPFYFSTQGNQGFNQHGSLDGHVQATGNAGTFQWLRSSVFLAIAIRPGISASAKRISLRPHSARLMSFTLYFRLKSMFVFVQNASKRRNACALDQKDLEILKLLQQNARNHQGNSEKVHLSTTPVHERIRRMEESGVIKQYVPC